MSRQYGERNEATGMCNFAIVQLEKGWKDTIRAAGDSRSYLHER